MISRFWSYMHEDVVVKRHFQWFGWGAAILFTINLLSDLFG